VAARIPPQGAFSAPQCFAKMWAGHPTPAPAKAPQPAGARAYLAAARAPPGAPPLPPPARTTAAGARTCALHALLLCTASLHAGALLQDLSSVQVQPLGQCHALHNPVTLRLSVCLSTPLREGSRLLSAG
jgi:hypothetical protein